jgi:hypothetical protein
MRDESKKPGGDPKPADVSKGRRHNVRAPARTEDRDLHDQPAHSPRSDSPTSTRKPNDDVTKKG